MMFQGLKTFLWKKKYLFLFVSLFLVVTTQRFLSERQNGLVNSVSSDGLGYYCYLPAAIIYQDFTYSYYDVKENYIKPFYKPYISPYKDKGVNKYYSGTAFCMLPFFLLGILISAIAGTDINGYTDTFLMLISIASLVYFLLAVKLLTKVAKHFLISEKTTMLVCFMVFLSTNLFHYTIQEPSMSHVYSFFAVSLFLYCFVRLLTDITTKRIVMLGLALALVILIRPVNVVVVLFTPFFFENFKSYLLFLKQIITKHFFGTLLFLLMPVLGVAIQFTFYYLQTGDFFVMTYEGETFDFKNPEIMNVLFSYRKGIFIYAPLLFLMVLFILLSTRFWFKRIIFFITMFVFIYITSSWWCWWYGGGLSIRPAIDFYPIIIITVLFLLNYIQPKTKKILLALSIPFVFFGQLIAFQYSNLLIDTVLMDKQKFWDVFLKTDLATINEDRLKSILENRKIFKMELMTYEQDDDASKIVDGGFKSKKACKVGKDNWYSKGFGFPIKDLGFSGSFYIVVECMAKTDADGRDLGLVVSIDANNEMVSWNVVFRNQFSAGDDGWAKMTQIVEVLETQNNDSNYLKVFANTEKGYNLVDDLKYTIIKK